MPLLHLRVCNNCEATRFAACSSTCGVPLDSDLSAVPQSTSQQNSCASWATTATAWPTVWLNTERPSK